MKKKIESKTADTILQRTREIKIGQHTFNAAPPSTATLILVSELIVELPQINLDQTKIESESLYIARHCRVLGDIIAVLILGAKNIKQAVKVTKKRFFGLKTEVQEITVDKQKELGRQILEELSPKELALITRELLEGMEIGFFFGFTTSLIEVNLTRATKQDPEKTTASGPQ